MFKGVFQYMPAVGVLFFGQFHPFHDSPLLCPPPVFQQFSIHILITSTFTTYSVQYYYRSVILFSFLLPKFQE
jgi:hypothetical protein